MLRRHKQGINIINSSQTNIFRLASLIFLSVMLLLLQVSRLAGATRLLPAVCDGMQELHVSC